MLSVWASVAAALLAAACLPAPARSATSDLLNNNFQSLQWLQINPSNYTNASSSAQLKASLSNASIWIVVLTQTVVLDAVDWATPVQLTHHVQVQGYNLPDDTTYLALDPFPPLVTLDCSNLVNIIQLGSGVVLRLWRLELLNHMQHDGTAGAYAGGMPIIDSGASGPGAFLAWQLVTSFVPVGLPLTAIESHMEKQILESWTAQDYFQSYDADYQAKFTDDYVTALDAAEPLCYKSSRRYAAVCYSGVRRWEGGRGGHAC
jgi:hypothetical protein